MKTINAVVTTESNTQKESVMTKLWNSLKNGTKATAKIISWSILGTLFISVIIPFIPGALLGHWASKKLDLYNKNFSVAISTVLAVGLATTVTAFVVAPVATLMLGVTAATLTALYTGYTKVKAFFAKRKEAKTC